MTNFSLSELVRLLERNAPRHPATFAACHQGCGGQGRGGGPCWGCVRAELVKRIGEARAGAICEAVIKQRDAT
jgi:hypothetical protein